MTEARAINRLFRRASWSLIDQGVVSLGSLLINLVLARNLTTAEYGVFALLFSAVMALQVITSSIFYYPLSQRLATLRGPAHSRLLSLSLILVVGTSFILNFFLAAGLIWFGYGDLILPAGALFLLWPLEETARRGLLANFRHRTAIIGDSVTYLGQAILVALLAVGGWLDLTSALSAMAAACALGAIIHLSRLTLTKPEIRETRPIMANLWSLGKWYLVINAILLLNVRIFPWALAVASGASAAAAFQAALNIANVINPLVIGLGNSIPQAAAQAHSTGGSAAAWRISRNYILLGLPPALAFSVVALAAPTFILRVFYGAHSPYLDIAFAVQIMALFWPARYIGDLVACFLNGVGAGRLAVMGYIVSLVTSVLALPLALPFGLPGIAGAMGAASMALLATSYWAVSEVIGEEKAEAKEFKAGSEGQPAEKPSFASRQV